MEILKELEKELPIYVSTIKSKHAENAKAMYFSSFIVKFFGVKPEEIDMEVPTKSFFLNLRGRIDAVFGRIILEFKKDLRLNLEDAKEELIKYLQSYHEKFPNEDYIGMANDGLFFKVFKPQFQYDDNHKKIAVTGLIEVDSLDLEREKDPYTIYLWFDSYLFSSEKVVPTSIDIKKRFGVDSPTYATFRYELEELWKIIKDKLPTITKFKNWAKYLEVVYGDEEKELDLFFRHTYLSTLVKLIVHVRLSGGKIPEKKDMDEILKGHVFHGYGIENFVDDDFFTWITYYPTKFISDPVIYKLLKELLVYDLEKIDEDVLKDLYQELVEPEQRQLLGEFYTPDWLAQLTIDEVMTNNVEGSVLDPSCGSGTFLFSTIRYKIKNLEKKYSGSDLLDHIVNSVRGFDIHPLAVIIAKTNYLLALRNLINFKKHPIEIPVYLCDSVKLPSENSDLFDQKPFFEFEADQNKRFKLPIEMIKKPIEIDTILSNMGNHGEIYGNAFERYRDSTPSMRQSMLKSVKENVIHSFKNSIHTITSEHLRNVWLENYQTLIELIDIERDSIWTYIIKNGYKPISIKNIKVDIIVGNPPWITMQKMKNERYQNFLKKETEHYNLLDADETKQFAHLELASLFFCIVVDLYLREGGKIGFVLPKSVLVASHHVNFRKFSKPNVTLEKIIDVENVTPLFKVPSCVLLASKIGTTSYPVPMINVSGKLNFKNIDLENAKKTLKITKTSFEPAVLSCKRSQYYDAFYEGATIVPRNFYFVSLVKDSFLGINPQAPMIKSDENNVTKKPWDKVILDGQVESNFLFGTLLGDDIIPFGNKGFRLVVLPILPNEDKSKIISTYSELQQKSFMYASSYFENAEIKWLKHATDKSKKMSIYQRLNYQRGITNQKIKGVFKVLYVASSTYLASCVVNTKQETKIDKNGINVNLNGFVAESKTYYFETNNEDEAYYLSSILNSKSVDLIIKPLQTRGLWGERDIHKRPLLLPIPLFSNSNPNHKKLADLGKICHNKTPQMLSEIHTKKIGNLRSEIRKNLQIELDEIDSLTKKTLTEYDNLISPFL